jgi:hypothetical protein
MGWIILHRGHRRIFASWCIEPETNKRRRLNVPPIQHAEGDMTIDRALLFSILMAASAAPGAGPALAQARSAVGRRDHLARRHAIEPVAASERHHRQ